MSGAVVSLSFVMLWKFACLSKTQILQMVGFWRNARTSYNDIFCKGNQTSGNIVVKHGRELGEQFTKDLIEKENLHYLTG